MSVAPSVVVTHAAGMAAVPTHPPSPEEAWSALLAAVQLFGL